jgi:hypothetical protein
MNRFLKIYLAYSPIINLLGIISADVISLISFEFYIKYYTWICILVGMSVLNSLQSLALIKLFKFCEISKYAVYSNLIFIPTFLVDYLIFGYETKGYRILQILIAIVAIFLTVKAYIKKYPNCTMTNYIKAKKYSLSIWNSFLKSLAKNNFQCETALEDYKHKRKKYHDERTN